MALPPSLAVGVVERKRMEVVLRAAGVPDEPKAFAAWVKREPETLVRLVTAVVGAAPEHREVVRGAVEEWWAAERARGEQRTGAIDWVVEGEWEEAIGQSVTAEPVAPKGRGVAWAAGLAVLVAVVLGGLWWLISRSEPEPEPTPSTATLDDGGTYPFPDTTDTTNTGGKLEDESSSGSDSTNSDSAEDSTDTGEVDLTQVYVRVSVASVEVEPGSFSIPWGPLGVAAVAMLVFVVLWRKPPPSNALPAAPEQEPQPTRRGRQPPRSPPLRRILLDRNARDTLVSGVTREATERPTKNIDVVRSIHATLETGVPTLCFHPATEYRGVWIWRDTQLDEHAELAERLQRELEATLADVGLPVQVAEFDGNPASLFIGPRRVSAAAMLGVGRPPRVVVLTDASQLVAQLHDASAQASARATLRLLRRWQGLALVDFGGPRSELAQLAHRWTIVRVTPEQAAAHLAGQVAREGTPVVSHDLLRWAVACAVVPRAIRDDQAQRVRQALGLSASPFDIERLRAEAGGGDGWLEWPDAQRAELLARYDRAYGYRQGWDRQRHDGAALLRRAIEHWLKVYDQAIARAEDAASTDRVAHWEVERAMLQLWVQPDEAARALYRWACSDRLGDEVRALVSVCTDRDGPSTRMRLPWRYEERDAEARLLLARMGLLVRKKEVRLQQGGRRRLAMGLAAGLALGSVVLGLAVGEAPEIVLDGDGPEGAEVRCDVRPGALTSEVACLVNSRLSHSKLEPVSIDARGSAGTVKVAWAVEEQPCEVERDGVTLVRCDERGRTPRQQQRWPSWQRVAVLGEEGKALARLLVATGSADYALHGQPGRPLAASQVAGMVQDGGRARWLVVAGDATSVESLEAAEVVVAVTQELPTLDFAGVRRVTEVWGEAEFRGLGKDFELVGLKKGCPDDMQFIAAGRIDEHEVSPLCLDTTEVTVASYEACMAAGECEAAGTEWGTAEDGYSKDEDCNRNHEDRQDHPINCVDWEQARAFCSWQGKRLPYQWEWEWAARGREEGRTYPWGDSPEPTCDRVVMDDSDSADRKRWGCDTGRTWPVGSKPKGSSRDGLSDMAGNVWEWTESESGDERIVRGGSRGNGLPGHFRASYRYSSVPSIRYSDVGFRCARTSGGLE